VAALCLRHDSPGLLGGIGLSLCRLRTLLFRQLAGLDGQTSLPGGLGLRLLERSSQGLGRSLVLGELPAKTVNPLLECGGLSGSFGLDLGLRLGPGPGDLRTEGPLAGFCRMRPLDRDTVCRIAIRLAQSLSLSELCRQDAVHVAGLAAGGLGCPSPAGCGLAYLFGCRSLRGR